MNQFRYRLLRFFQGRYGTDQLNRGMFALAIVFALLAYFPKLGFLIFPETLLFILILLRMFSKNISKRYAENQKYLALTSPIRSFFRDILYNLRNKKAFHERNKGYKIFSCPRCGQRIRIPKGRGKVEIHCQKCSQTFIRRT
ncbi:MAG: transcription elongation factor 1 family protein [Lachnospiraceae bacterium]|nr:transcription elongation factor 1 family protein [Lachnospiraceae bacterium]